MTNFDLEKLKSSLPFGYTNEIRLLSKKSKAYISLVLSGKRKNKMIIDIAIQMALKEKVISEKREQLLAEL
jgi:hypothetical protein